jgi:prepilin-type N-terminal cleavage/methylation domain-containing protein
VSRRTPHARRRQAGFTLIELLMGIVLASIFALALYGFFFTGLDSARSHQSQAIAQSTGRTAIDRLASEIRQSISPDDGLTPPLIALSPTNLELYVDPSRSVAATTPRPEKVRYAIVSNQLVRERALPVGVTPPYSYGAYANREVLIDKLQNGATAAFGAVTPEGAALPATPTSTQLRDAAQVSVRLMISQKTGNAASMLELNTDVALRNAIRL